MQDCNRRRFIIAGSAVGMALAAPGIVRATSPEFVLRFANFSATSHPVNIRMAQARDRIVRETDGRVDIQTVPAGQLGSNDEMLKQIQSGTLDLFLQSGLVLATVAPAASISGIGFAFSDYGQVWKALDGELGRHIVKDFANSEIVALDRPWDNGFRQTTSSSRPIRTPEDLSGFKIRVPQWPLWTSMYTALGATPVSIPWGQTYAGLKSGTADGVENPLAGIQLAKLYEVQKYLSRTNHIWDGFWFLANRKKWERIPEGLRATIESIINDAAVKERADVARIQEELLRDLVAKGLQLSEVEHAPFRQKLRQAGFYAEWKSRFNAQVWELLESVAGKLA
jgi:tripartite ATP-independent transporter DctP family solute receptor